MVNFQNALLAYLIDFRSLLKFVEKNEENA